MVNLNIDFDKADKISNGLSELSSECANIVSSSKNVDAGRLSFSSGIAAYCSKIQSDVGKISTQVSNLQSSFNGSIDLYRQAYESQKESVDTAIGSSDSLNVGTPITVDDMTASELSATVDFYFNYPSAIKSIKAVSESKLRNLFTANGATKVGSDMYSFSIDGKKYKFNVVTNEIIIEGSREESLRCKFYTTSDTSFSDITNTVTLLAGSGEINKGFDTNIKVNSNSLVIIPYGSHNIPNMPAKVSGCTRVGDFLAGGKNKKIVNTIVGYSLGGQAAYSAVAANKGLYSKMAVVNSAPMTSSGGTNYIERNGGYDAFKNVDIYIFEGSGDSFISSTIEGLKRFRNNKVPMGNIHVYTNDSNLLSTAQKLLPSGNVYKVDSSYAKSHRGWSGHSYGYDMLKDSGVLSYLSGCVGTKTATIATTDVTTLVENNDPYALNVGAKIDSSGSSTVTTLIESDNTSSLGLTTSSSDPYALNVGTKIDSYWTGNIATLAENDDSSGLTSGASIASAADTGSNDPYALNVGPKIGVNVEVDNMAVKGGKMIKITYDGKQYYVANTKINCVDYQKYVSKNRLTQNNGLLPGDCMLLSQYYAVDMMRGTKTNGSAMAHCEGGPALRINDYVSSPTQGPVLKYVYQELLAGRPTVLQVTQVNSDKGDRHLVTVVGCDASVQSYKDLNPDTILVLDCVDGKLQTLSKSRASGGHERKLFAQGGNYFVRGATDEFLRKEVYKTKN